MVVLLIDTYNRIDRFSIGDGLPGPLTRKLTDLYYDLVDGTSDSNSSW